MDEHDSPGGVVVGKVNNAWLAMPGDIFDPVFNIQAPIISVIDQIVPCCGIAQIAAGIISTIRIQMGSISPGDDLLGELAETDRIGGIIFIISQS